MKELSNGLKYIGTGLTSIGSSMEEMMETREKLKN